MLAQGKMSSESTPLLQNAQKGYTKPNPGVELHGDSAIEQQVQGPPQKSLLVFVGAKFLNLLLG